MNCLLCKTAGQVLTEQFYYCPNCKCHFAKPSGDAKYDGEYAKLYPGMSEFCEQLKDSVSPWVDVSVRGFPYAKVMEYFTNRERNLDVLDVGCGWGYLAYALNALGFKTTGIDITSEGVEFAKRTYGLPYHKTTVEEYQGKHDVVVAVEVFEHVPNPKEWLKRCLEIAPKVVLTTPNISHYGNAAWTSDPPPIHLACYRRESLEWLAKELDVRVEIDSSGPNLIAIYER